MTPKQYLDRYFFGQENVKRSIAILTQQICTGDYLNILIRGPSGYGKTRLAHLVYNYVRWKTPTKLDYKLFIGDDFTIPLNNFVNYLLDEAHLISTPEILYPHMDRRTYNFIFCTNEYGDIKEPLERRCFVETLDEYTIDELMIIAKTVVDLPEEYLRILAQAGRYSPGILITICKRVKFYIEQEGMFQNVDHFREVLTHILRINEGGFTDLDNRYLELLQNMGVASLNTICSVLKVPRGTILNDIEPFLIRKNLITITTKGRKLCYQ